ncbi:hypothetical protein PBAL39_22500 [Pedobacter sp. BAL39]|uniref:hypothetical protein n=1 Tax=Pedobacter sp. BAL39 TaxID=391596 RepID=UPI000155979F|nr:hypothetical protein [Pedobacter sp. BAL39]EDM38891.1 hypothetical protein PBAL39_22500 [Pedobacter sp. BAL39]
MSPKIGILAYGSLINDPGKEIEPLIIDRIACVTPFAIEYARLSSTRNDAPTLIPVKEGGAKVKAQILVLECSISLTQAEDMLWRRETRQKTNVKPYPRNKEPGKNSVTVIRIDNFEGVDQVIYTSIPSNIGLNSPGILAGLAVQSILQEAGERQMDGVRYLLDAKRNGIKTLISEAYEQEILKHTETESLEAAIEKLDALRPAHLARAAALSEFEKEVVELTDLILAYGMNKTTDTKGKTYEEFQALIQKNKETFITNVHEGFKLAQTKIVNMLLGFETEKDQLQAEITPLNRKKEKTRVDEIESLLDLIHHKEAVLRHLIDTIVWQQIKGQLYIARRLYQGVKGEKRLLKSNIESVISAANELNKDPLAFALITDLSAYIQVGDILMTDGKDALHFIEVKQGRKNHEIIQVMDDVLKSDKSMEEIFKDIKHDKKTIQQLDRNMKQFSGMFSLMEILNTDKGTDPSSGKPVKIITPKEETPYFHDRLHGLYAQLQARNMWAYDVIERCLHIALYEGPFRRLGPLLLKSMGDQHGGNYIIVDFLSIIKSLHKPLFFLPFPRVFLFDIIFGRVKLFFMLEIEKYLKLFEAFEMQAEWLSKKETMKVVEGEKDHGVFIYQNRAIRIKHKGTNLESIVSTGLFGKMFFEHILPSYTAYTQSYFLDKNDPEAPDAAI